MRLREADRFSDEVCRLATTEVKRFWIAPRSARVLLIAPRALSTTSIACCAPFTVDTSILSANCLPGTGVAAAKPASELLMAVKAPALFTLSLTEVRVSAPAASVSASTPVSPILALMAATTALPFAAVLAAASPTLLTVMAPKLKTVPLLSVMVNAPTAVSVSAVPAIAVAVPLENCAPPSALALASMVLSMAMAWPALAPTWNSWLENVPSSSLVPLKSDCLATRSISETSWVTSACSALRSLAELVALEACTDSSRTRCRLLPISVSEPSATWASEMPSLALRMATSVPRICVPKRSEIARPAASSLALLMREPEDRRWMVVASELPLVLRLR